MIYSMGCEYAIRAMTYLAEHAPEGQYCLLRDVTSDDTLPRHFVGKIFQSLVRNGMLNSAKGRGGGFALRQPPEEIRLLDIVQAVDGIEWLTRCVVGLAKCDDHQPCPQHDGWKLVRGHLERFLTETTLADMARCVASKRPARSRLSKPVQIGTSHKGKA